MTTLFETRRLILREMDSADLAFVTAMLTDPEVMRFWPRPYLPEECEAWISRQRARYAADGCGYWLVADRVTGIPLGQAGILVTDVEGTAEAALGYIVHRPHWRKGYALESSLGCLEFAFGRLKAERVVALVRPENLPSIRVAERLGMKAGQSVLFADLEHVVYALDRRKWAGRAKGLRTAGGEHS